MTKQIEVEVRGKIQDFEKTLNNFKEKAKFVEEKDRISFIYFREGAKEVRDVVDDPVDLKLRVTNKKAEIVMKYGKWGSQESRKEFLFPIELGKFGQALEFFKYLNWNNGILMDTKTFVFDYKEIEFALVKSGEFSYFEAEILVENQEEVEKSLEKIREVCNEMNLLIFESEEFIQLMNDLNARDDRKFNMLNQNFEEIKEKFSEYF